MTSEEFARRVLTVKAGYNAAFGQDPKLVVRAPGRVNLIGEHTDYNEGFVFPAAIDREMLIAASLNSDNPREVRVFSIDYKQEDVFNLDNIEKSPKHPWADYLRGTLAILIDAGYNVRGFTAALSGNVPQGAGLSSSAAYEVAVITLVKTLCDLSIDGKQIALLAQKAENQFIGVQCGIMDQFISSLGQSDSALFIDCRSLSYKPVPLRLSRQGLSIVITHCGVKRGLVDSEYNARRSECQQGVELLSTALGRQLRSLRDVTFEEFQANAGKLPPVVAKRCRHVIGENKRVQDAVDALEKGELDRFGKLMVESHNSLRDDYQVSCRELDRLVELSLVLDGVLGARMTGAGFGGCTVAIMPASKVEDYRSLVLPRYESDTGRKTELYVCQAVAGAGIVESPVRT